MKEKSFLHLIFVEFRLCLSSVFCKVDTEIIRNRYEVDMIRQSLNGIWNMTDDSGLSVQGNIPGSVYSFLLDAGKIFENRPELTRAKDLRLKEHDFLFSDTEMDSMLGLLKVENSSNSMALDYLMSWCLLRKDLDRFVECISMVTAPVMPKAYQEALLLRWVLTHSDFQGLPAYIAPAHAQRISRFIADVKAGKSEDEMLHTYGDTYWFYYYYRSR